MSCIKLQWLHFLYLITIFFLSCLGMKRRLSFETLNWLHDLSNDIHERCHDKPHVRLHDRQHEWHHMTPCPWQTKIEISGQFCSLAMFYVCAQNPCMMRWKVTLVAFGWLIDFFLFMTYSEKNETTQNKQPYSTVSGPSMAVRPSEEQPLWYFCTKINWWQ